MVKNWRYDYSRISNDTWKAFMEAIDYNNRPGLALVKNLLEGDFYTKHKDGFPADMNLVTRIIVSRNYAAAHGMQPRNDVVGRMMVIDAMQNLMELHKEEYAAIDAGTYGGLDRDVLVNARCVLDNMKNTFSPII